MQTSWCPNSLSSCYIGTVLSSLVHTGLLANIFLIYVRHLDRHMKETLSALRYQSPAFKGQKPDIIARLAVSRSSIKDMAGKEERLSEISAAVDCRQPSRILRHVLKMLNSVSITLKPPGSSPPQAPGGVVVIRMFGPRVCTTI